MTRSFNSPSFPGPYEERKPARYSAVDDSDRLDLDHRVGVGKAADLHRRAGRRGRAEIAQPHVVMLGELRVVGDVGIGLDDVGESGAGGFEAGLDILADLLDLGRISPLPAQLPLA